MDLILSLTCCNQSTVHERRVIWISVSFPSPCRCTCSSTHENIGEPAIIFFTGSLLASGRRTGSLHWCTCRRPPPSPHPPSTLRPSAASTGGITGAAFLAADNEHGTEWTLESRLHTAEVGGNKQQKEDSDRHRWVTDGRGNWQRAELLLCFCFYLGKKKLWSLSVWYIDFFTGARFAKCFIEGTFQ